MGGWGPLHSLLSVLRALALLPCPPELSLSLCLVPSLRPLLPALPSARSLPHSSLPPCLSTSRSLSLLDRPPPPPPLLLSFPPSLALRHPTALFSPIPPPLPLPSRVLGAAYVMMMGRWYATMITVSLPVSSVISISCEPPSSMGSALSIILSRVLSSLTLSLSPTALSPSPSIF
eukprot:scaffold1900_cov32-Tisochrysis_lutea.AAC.8